MSRFDWGLLACFAALFAFFTGWTLVLLWIGGVL